MGSRREEERNEKIIRGLLKLPPNRRCINCNSAGPQYVCTNFWTFVCLTCSGIHREFTHRVKSISMSKFTKQEIEALQQGGNQRARDIYLKGWDMEQMRFPSNSYPDKIREFIRSVYVDMKYAAGISSNETQGNIDGKTDGDRDLRRPSSYHSYSQSPPYDYQYEERIYGKAAGAFARKQATGREPYEGKLARFLQSPDRARDLANEEQFKGDNSSRFSDFSVASDPYRYEGRSQSFQDSGRFSDMPSPRPVRNTPIETSRFKLQRHSTSSLHAELGAVEVSSSGGSFRSFGDNSSATRKSIGSGGSADATIQTTLSSVHQVSQSSSLPPSDNFGYSGSNTATQGADVYSGSGSHTDAAVVHAHSVIGKHQAPISLPMQPSTPINHEEINQAYTQSSLPHYQSVDLFADFTGQHLSMSSKAVDMKMIPPELTSAHTTNYTTVHPEQISQASIESSVLPSQPVDLSAAFSGQSSVQASNAAHPGIHDNIAKDIIVSPGFQEQFAFSLQSLPAHQLSSSNPPNQTLASPHIQLHVDSSTPADTFYSYQHPHVHAPNLKPQMSRTPVSSNEHWATFEISQPDLCHTNSSMQDQPLPYNTSVLQPFWDPTTVEASHGTSDHLVKSTNPFDLAYETDFEANKMFMDMTAVQAALPTQHAHADYAGSLPQMWYPQNPTPTFVPSVPQSGNMPMSAQAPNSKLYLPPRGPYVPRNPFE